MTRRVLGLAAVVLAATAFLLTRGDDRVQASDQVPPLATIAHRVEQLRGLRFTDGLPKVRRLTAVELQREFNRKVDNLAAKERRRARSEQDLLKLLGFENAKARPSALGNASGILGVYDPPTKTLIIVTDVQGSRAQRELTYAHELTHALEDQHFGLPSINGGNDDAATARRALVEGSARFTELAYARRYLGHDVTTKELAARVPAATIRGQINYFANSDRFAYLDGSRYIARLVREGGQQARDAAFRSPPVATADVLHPPRDSDPPRVALHVGRVARGYQRVESGTMGEFDTSQLLVLGALIDEDTARRDAATGSTGLLGGHYELWRAGSRDIRGCSSPCLERDLLAIRWRFGDAEQARQFAAVLPSYLEDYQKLDRVAGGWRSKVAAVAVRRRGAQITLAEAPALGLARVVSKGS